MPRLIPTPAEIQKHLLLLEDTPRRIGSCTAGIDEGQLRSPPGKRAWSIVDIFAHLRACDHLWAYSIYAMLAHEDPVLPLLDERRWAKTARYADLNFAASLQAFAIHRDQLLLVLRELPGQAWIRTATIEGRRHSVFSQVRRLALHENEHCDQIQALVRGDTRT